MPEIAVYCKLNAYKCTEKLPEIAVIMKDMTFDKLFSNLYLQTDVFIPYFSNYTKTDTSLYSSNMVSYLKYIFTEDLLGK